MGSIFGREEGTRWPRGQKFRLSPLGAEAEANYQAALALSREQQGRAAFDEAVAIWATTFGVRASDAVYLCELKCSESTVVDLVKALQDCGATKSEAKAAIDRLVGAKLAEAPALPA